MKKVIIFLILFSGLFSFIQKLEAEEIGVVRGNKFYIDINGNFSWDQSSDLVTRFGLNGDVPVTGDWNGDGLTDIGVVRGDTWYLDSNGNFSWDVDSDLTIRFGFREDVPVTGDWNGDGLTDIGVFRGDTWYLDSNGNDSWDERIDLVVKFGLNGDVPVTGDWNEDGVTDIGVVRGDKWYLDSNGNFIWDQGIDSMVKFGLKKDIPVAGNFSGDSQVEPSSPPSLPDTWSDDFEDGVMGPQWAGLGSATYYSETGGMLRCDINSGSGFRSAGYTSSSLVSGDFDFQVDFSNYAITGGTGWTYGYLRFIIDGSNQTFIIREKSTTGTDRFRVGIDINGVWTNYNYNTTATSGKLRISRVGGTVNYWYDTGAGWVLARTETGFPTGAGTIRAYLGTDNSSVTGTMNFDNFKDNPISAPAPQIGPAYYVDFDNGNDFNAGTASNTPFKHAPGDDNATGTAASITLMPGDTVIFKGGVVYYGRVDADWSGSSGNYITYKSGHLVSWGTGRAILDGTSITYDSSHIGVLSLKGNRYLKAEGLHVRNVPFGNAYIGGIGWKGNTHGEVDIVIDNVEATNNSNGIMIQGIWYEDADPPTGFVIRNSVLHENLQHGILLRVHVEDIIVENSQIYNNGWEGGANVGDGIFFSGNTSPGVGRAVNVVVRNSEFYDGIEKGHMLLAGVKNLIVENNKFYEKDNYVRFGIGMVRGENVTIRNNLFIDTNDTRELEGLVRYYGTAPGEDLMNLEVYNNTFVGTSLTAAIHLRTGGGSACDNIKIKNNIFINDAGTDDYIYIQNFVPSNFESENNIFYNGDTRPFNWAGASLTLTEWKNVTRQDLKSSEQNPSLNANYRPDNPLDPPVNAGTDLSATGFANDKNGTQRPQSLSWDIGCYELVY